MQKGPDSAFLCAAETLESCSISSKGCNIFPWCLGVRFPPPPSNMFCDSEHQQALQTTPSTYVEDESPPFLNSKSTWQQDPCAGTGWERCRDAGLSPQKTKSKKSDGNQLQSTREKFSTQPHKIHSQAFSHPACAHMPGAHVWMHPDKQGLQGKCAVQPLCSQPSLSPRCCWGHNCKNNRFNNTDHQETPKGTCFGPNKAFPQHQANLVFYTKSAHCTGSPGEPAPPPCAPRPTRRRMASPKMQSTLGTAEGFAAVCLRNKASLFWYERNRGVEANQILHASWPEFSLSGMQCSAVLSITSATSVVDGETRQQEIHLAASQTGVWQQHPRL